MAEIGITLAIAAERLQRYLTAETKVLENQSYEIGERKLTRADLREIREGIAYWQAHVERLDPAPATLRPVGRVRRGSYRIR